MHTHGLTKDIDTNAQLMHLMKVRYFQKTIFLEIWKIRILNKCCRKYLFANSCLSVIINFPPIKYIILFFIYIHEEFHISPAKLNFFKLSVKISKDGEMRLHLYGWLNGRFPTNYVHYFFIHISEEFHISPTKML